MTAIHIRGLSKRYGDHPAVDGVSFDVFAGEIFVLLGPNGAGKTTTIEIALGLRKPDEGSVEVLGSAPAARRLAPRVGAMPQRGDLYPGIRTREALKLFASFYDQSEDPDWLLEVLELGRVGRTPYRRLSGGERRRLSLALALVGRPELVFLDEPTAEMDVEGQRRAWSLIAGLRERKTTVVLSTHSLDEAERIADRVAILVRGRLAALGTPAELRGEGDGLSFRVSNPIDGGSLGAALGARVETLDGVYRVQGVAVTPDVVSRLATWMSARGVLLTSLEAGSRSLEDVYMELVS